MNEFKTGRQTRRGENRGSGISEIEGERLRIGGRRASLNRGDETTLTGYKIDLVSRRAIKPLLWKQIERELIDV